MKPPTAMVAASMPVAKPSGMVNSTEIFASSALKYIIVPGMWIAWTLRASALTFSAASASPER